VVVLASLLRLIALILPALDSIELVTAKTKIKIKRRAEAGKEAEEQTRKEREASEEEQEEGQDPTFGFQGRDTMQATNSSAADTLVAELPTALSMDFGSLDSAVRILKDKSEVARSAAIHISFAARNHASQSQHAVRVHRCSVSSNSLSQMDSFEGWMGLEWEPMSDQVLEFHEGDIIIIGRCPAIPECTCATHSENCNRERKTETYKQILHILSPLRLLLRGVLRSIYVVGFPSDGAMHSFHALVAYDPQQEKWVLDVHLRHFSLKGNVNGVFSTLRSQSYGKHADQTAVGQACEAPRRQESRLTLLPNEVVYFNDKPTSETPSGPIRNSRLTVETGLSSNEHGNIPSTMVRIGLWFKRGLKWKPGHAAVPPSAGEKSGRLLGYPCLHSVSSGCLIHRSGVVLTAAHAFVDPYDTDPAALFYGEQEDEVMLLIGFSGIAADGEGVSLTKWMYCAEKVAFSQQHDLALIRIVRRIKCLPSIRMRDTVEVVRPKAEAGTVAPGPAPAPASASITTTTAAVTTQILTGTIIAMTSLYRADEPEYLLECDDATLEGGEPLLFSEEQLRVLPTPAWKDPSLYEGVTDVKYIFNRSNFMSCRGMEPEINTFIDTKIGVPKELRVVHDDRNDAPLPSKTDAGFPALELSPVKMQQGEVYKVFGFPSGSVDRDETRGMELCQHDANLIQFEEEDGKRLAKLGQNGCMRVGCSGGPVLDVHARVVAVQSRRYFEGTDVDNTHLVQPILSSAVRGWIDNSLKDDWGIEKFELGCAKRKREQRGVGIYTSPYRPLDQLVDSLYTVVDPNLGEGAFGKIVLCIRSAYDASRGESMLVAVKIPHLDADKKCCAAQAECKALLRVRGCPHIINMQSVEFERSGVLDRCVPLLVMEYIPMNWGQLLYTAVPRRVELSGSRSWRGRVQMGFYMRTGGLVNNVVSFRHKTHKVFFLVFVPIDSVSTTDAYYNRSHGRWVVVAVRNDTDQSRCFARLRHRKKMLMTAEDAEKIAQYRSSIVDSHDELFQRNDELDGAESTSKIRWERSEKGKWLSDPMKAIHVHMERTGTENLYPRETKTWLRQQMDITIQVLRGLEHLHSKKFVWGDPSINNVLIATICARSGRPIGECKDGECVRKGCIDDGLAKITDLGNARELRQQNGDRMCVRAENRGGTRLYRAPEQVEGGATNDGYIDEGADVYGVAACFLHTIIGWCQEDRLQPASGCSNIMFELRDYFQHPAARSARQFSPFCTYDACPYGGCCSALSCLRHIQQDTPGNLQGAPHAPLLGLLDQCFESDSSSRPSAKVFADKLAGFFCQFFGPSTVGNKKWSCKACSSLASAAAAVAAAATAAAADTAAAAADATAASIDAAAADDDDAATGATAAVTAAAGTAAAAAAAAAATATAAAAAVATGGATGAAGAAGAAAVLSDEKLKCMQCRLFNQQRLRHRSWVDPGCRHNMQHVYSAMEAEIEGDSEKAERQYSQQRDMMPQLQQKCLDACDDNELFVSLESFVVSFQQLNFYYSRLRVHENQAGLYKIAMAMFDENQTPDNSIWQNAKEMLNKMHEAFMQKKWMYLSDYQGKLLEPKDFWQSSYAKDLSVLLDWEQPTSVDDNQQRECALCQLMTQHAQRLLQLYRQEDGTREKPKEGHEGQEITQRELFSSFLTACEPLRIHFDQYVARSNGRGAVHYPRVQKFINLAPENPRKPSAVPLISLLHAFYNDHQDKHNGSEVCAIEQFLQAPSLPYRGSVQTSWNSLGQLTRTFVYEETKPLKCCLKADSRADAECFRELYKWMQEHSLHDALGCSTILSKLLTRRVSPKRHQCDDHNQDVGTDEKVHGGIAPPANPSTQRPQLQPQSQPQSLPLPAVISVAASSTGRPHLTIAAASTVQRGAHPTIDQRSNSVPIQGAISNTHGSITTRSQSVSAPQQHQQHQQQQQQPTKNLAFNAALEDERRARSHVLAEQLALQCLEDVQPQAKAIREQQDKVQAAERKWQECVRWMHRLLSQDLAVSDAMESTIMHEQSEPMFRQGLPRSISHSVTTPTIGSSAAAGGTWEAVAGGGATSPNRAS
jgi:serine/threonine protein kinase